MDLLVVHIRRLEDGLARREQVARAVADRREALDRDPALDGREDLGAQLAVARLVLLRDEDPRVRRELRHHLRIELEVLAARRAARRAHDDDLALNNVRLVDPPGARPRDADAVAHGLGAPDGGLVREHAVLAQAHRRLALFARHGGAIWVAHSGQNAG